MININPEKFNIFSFEEILKREKKVTQENKPKTNDNSFYLNYKPITSIGFVTNVGSNINYRDRYILFFFYNKDDKEAKEFLFNDGGIINNISDSIDIMTVYDKACLEHWGLIKGENIVKKSLTDKINDSYRMLDNIAKTFNIYSFDYPALVIYDLVDKKYSVKYFRKYNSILLSNEIENIINKLNRSYGSDISCFDESSKLNNKLSKKIKDDFLDLYERYTDLNRGSKNKICDYLKIDDKTLYRRINSNNLYKVFDRDEIIIMSFIFRLSLEQTNEFLISYNVRELQGSDYRDSIIMNGIINDYSLEKLNTLLIESNLEILKGYKNRINYNE